MDFKYLLSGFKEEKLRSKFQTVELVQYVLLNQGLKKNR